MTFAILLLSASLAQVPAPGLENLFQAGIEAYDAQDYEGAISSWAKLRRFRVASPAVEFNLGNAYYQGADYGRAVLHWERALRLAPGDGDARENLILVRTLLVDDLPVDETALAPVVSWLRSLGRRETMATVAFAAWQLLGVFGLAALIATGNRRRVAIASTVAVLLVVVVMVPIVLLQIQGVENDHRYVVLAQAIDVRSGPGNQFTSVFSVHEGLVLEGRESASGWRRVRLANGLDGWISAAAIERI